MTKQAWYNQSKYDGHFNWVRVELTGRCKKITGLPSIDGPRYRVEVQKYSWFGLHSYTEWLIKDRIKICDVVTDEIYECDCFKEAQDATG